MQRVGFANARLSLSLAERVFALVLLFRAGEGAPLIDEPAGLRDQLCVTVGDRLRRLRPPAHDDPVPVDRDVGVVTRGLGDGQPVDEVDRCLWGAKTRCASREIPDLQAGR
jgi:hypothetical protein